MKPILIFIIFATLLAVGSINTSMAQTPEQLYQKGLGKEEGEGALQDAISLFNKVADNSNAGTSLQAKALLHIGMCYEKLGMKEATKAYQRLVNNFPAQKNEVAIARERLLRLVQITDKVIETPLTPKFTKIKIPTKLSWSVKLAPDGKNLALVSESKLWIMPLSGNIGPDFPGKPVQINTENIDVEWSGLAWSGDGKWIAFNEELAKKNLIEKPEKQKYNQGIFIVPSNGGKPKKVIENYRDARVVNYRISLSPDASKLAYTSVENNEQHIYTTQVDGGSPEKLTDIQAREPVFSPDGKMIAFVEDKNLGRGEGGLGLWVTPAQGGTSHLLADAKTASSPVWSPNGSMIAFIDISNKKQINLVDVPKDWKAAGKVTSINAPENTEEVTLLAGWTPNNKIGLLLTLKREFALYTLPAKGGQAAIISNDCYAFQPRWSLDGKKIFYVTPPAEGENKSYRLTLASVSAGGGIGKPILKEHDGKVITQFPYQSGNRISPDGKMLISSAWTSSDTMGVSGWPNSKIWEISIDGKESKQITNQEGRFADMCPSWSPDGKKIAFIRAGLKEDLLVFDKVSMYTISPSDGELKMLIPETDKYIFSPVWSPDGKMIAYITKDKETTSEAPMSRYMNVVNVENGSIRVVGEVPKAHVNIELAWSPDSRRIAFNDDNVIKIMNIDDGKIEDIKTNLVDVEIWHLDWSPDGEQFVFSGMKGGNAEFWFLENFLPLEKLAQKNKPEDLSIRKVLSDAPSEPLGTPSPDGRYISFVDWDSGGNICIMDLKTKEKRCLTNYTDPYEQAYYSSWSTDGNNIAYTWWDKVGTNLSVVDIKESKSRVLLKSDKVDWIELGNWSSDGKYIVATLSLPGQSESQIVRISSSDGSIQILKTFEKSYLGGKPYFSPDNSYVAYNVPDEKVSGNCDIYIFSLEDEHENALFKHPAHDYILGWTPDGKNILFASDRTGTMDAMIIGVEEGKSIGQPKSIIQNVGPITPMGFTQKGSFYYGQWPETQNIYTAKIDFENGKILTQPTLAIRRYEGKNHAPSYSNNGKFLAYISDRGFSSRIAKPVNVLCIRDLETDKESEIIPDPEIGLIRSLLWSPDDRSITIMCFNQEKYARIYDYDIQTKKFTPLVPGSNDHLSDMNYIYPLWSRDGKLLYYLQASRNSQSSRIMIRNIVTGNESELYRYSSNDYYDRIFTLSLSPDGKWLSAISIGVNKVVKLISTSDGKARDLYTFKSATGEGPYSQLWSRDGKYIIFPYPKKPTSGELEWNLMRIPFEGGENHLIKMDILGIYDPSLHPDGRTLSFESTGYSKPENNIWAMENFLPK